MFAVFNLAISRRSSCTLWRNSSMVVATVRFYARGVRAVHKTEHLSAVFGSITPVTPTSWTTASSDIFQLRLGFSKKYQIYVAQWIVRNPKLPEIGLHYVHFVHDDTNENFGSFTPIFIGGGRTGVYTAYCTQNINPTTGTFHVTWPYYTINGKQHPGPERAQQ